MVGSGPRNWLATQVHSLRYGTAALLAGNSVAWRLLPDAAGRRLVDVLDVALDGLAGALVGAAVTLTLADLRLLGVAFDAGLYLYLVSQLLPRFLPDGPPAGPVLGSDRVAYAASVAVLCLGFPVSMLVPVAFAASPLAVLSSATGLSVTEPSTAQFGQFFIAWCALLCGGLGLYVYVAWWRDASVQDRVRFFDQMVATQIDREEVGQNLSRDDWVARGSNFFSLFASVSVLVVVFAFFAVLSGFAIILFPLPELVLLATIVVGAVARLTPGDRWSRLAARRVDIEERFFLVFRYVRTSRKGFFVVPYLVIGLLGSMLLALISNAGVIIIAYAVLIRPGEMARIAFQSPLRTWAAFAALGCIIVPGLYSLWFWFREVARLPHYLAYWERTHPGGAPLESATGLPTPPTRPFGNLLLPSLLFVPLFSVLTLVDGEPPVAVVAALAVGCSTLLAVIGWNVRRTRHAPPQHPRTDGWAILLAFLVQLGWLWLFLGGQFIPNVGTSFGLTTVGFIAAATSLLYLLPEFECYLDANSTSEYTTAAMTALIGVGTLLFATFWAVFGPVDSGLSRLLVAAGILFLLLGALAAAAQWTVDGGE